MKHMLFLIMLSSLLLGLTGCVDKEENTIKSIPQNIQGLYVTDIKSYTGNFTLYLKVEANSVKEKFCPSSKNCNFDDGQTGITQTISYSLENLRLNNDDDDRIYVDLYLNGEKSYKCFSSFGKFMCDSKSGNSVIGRKQ